MVSCVASIGILAALAGAHLLAWRLERPWREALEERRGAVAAPRSVAVAAALAVRSG